MAALEVTGGNFGGSAVNQWILTNPRTMLITLDASVFGNSSPQILLNSPSGRPSTFFRRRQAKTRQSRSRAETSIVFNQLVLRSFRAFLR